MNIHLIVAMQEMATAFRKIVHARKRNPYDGTLTTDATASNAMFYVMVTECAAAIVPTFDLHPIRYFAFNKRKFIWGVPLM